jgi:helicase
VAKISQITDDATINLALDTIRIKKQAIVFVNSKNSAEKTAENLSKKLKDTPEFEHLVEFVLHSLAKPTKQCERLAKCIKKGVAFHHAGLTSKQKTVIEDGFRKGEIKVICSTPTLAMGLDLPAFRAIMKTLKRYGRRGLQYIPVLEYLQMAGRAGRPKYDSYGESIIVSGTKAEKEELHEKFICGKPEDIYSKLAVEPVLRTYVLSLIATNYVNSKKDLVEFFSKTFWAHQFKDMFKIESIIDKILGLLEDWEFLIGYGNDFQSANELGEEKFKATRIGKRVAELYIDPLTAHNLINGIQRAASMNLNDISFLQLVSNTLEMRPLLRVRVSEYDIVGEELVKNSEFILQDEPSLYESEYEDFINSVKTAMFLKDWINEKGEEDLLEKYNIRPGEIKVKVDLADWLLYCSEEFVKMLAFQPLIKEIAKMRIRVKNGVKEEIITLLRLKGVGRVRARKMYNARIRDLGDLKKVDITKLVQLLGKGIALSLKEQVGQDMSKIVVKERKRKGQISLKDYV